MNNPDDAREKRHRAAHEIRIQVDKDIDEREDRNPAAGLPMDECLADARASIIEARARGAESMTCFFDLGAGRAMSEKVDVPAGYSISGNPYKVARSLYSMARTTFAMLFLERMAPETPAALQGEVARHYYAILDGLKFFDVLGRAVETDGRDPPSGGAK